MNKFIKFFALAVVAIGLSSCLKDKNIDDLKYGMVVNESKIIEIPLATKGLALVYENVPASLDFVSVALAAAEPAAEDVIVTLSLDKSAALISDYNTANSTSLVALPTSLYTLPGGLTVTIPKGSKVGILKLNMNPINLDPSTTYGLGLRIESVSKAGYIVSGNFATTVVRLAAKNKYDGNYALTGMLSGVTDRPTLKIGSEFTWPGNLDIITATGNAVDIYDTHYNWGGGIAQWITPIPTPTSYSAFGSVRPRITFDLTTNKVTSVTNMFANPTNGRALALDATYDSKYVPATKLIDVRFIMTQPGSQPLTISYKFTYKASRK